MAYTETTIPALTTTTPTENSSYVPELNDAIREIKTALQQDSDGYIARQTGCIGWKDADEIYIYSNRIRIKDKLVKWNSTLTKDVGSPSASTWYYVYVDYSAVTTGTDVTATEIITSTTAPTWNDTWMCWMNAGFDRCLGCFLTDGSSNVLSFSWNLSSRYVLDVAITELSAQSDTTFTDVDLTSSVPNFGEMEVELITLVTDTNDANGLYPFIYLRKNGSAETVQVIGLQITDSGVATLDSYSYDTIKLLTDSSQVIEYKVPAGGAAATIYVKAFNLKV
jgi:hypothetical protein